MQTTSKGLETTDLRKNPFWSFALFQSSHYMYQVKTSQHFVTSLKKMTLLQHINKQGIWLQYRVTGLAISI